MNRGGEVDVPEADQPEWMRHPILDRQVWHAIADKLNNPARRVGLGAAPRWLGSGLFLCGACADKTCVRVTGGSSATARPTRRPSGKMTGGTSR
jgi:site-specific DNA recombinase